MQATSDKDKQKIEDGMKRYMGFIPLSFYLSCCCLFPMGRLQKSQIPEVLFTWSADIFSIMQNWDLYDFVLNTIEIIEAVNSS